MQHVRKPSYSALLTLLSAATLAACTLEEPKLDEDDKTADSEKESADDETAGDTDDQSNSDGGSSDGAYEIKGGTLADAAFKLSPQRNLQPLEECPFPPESPPCTDDACLSDPDSKECQDVVEAYCLENPEEEACGDGPGGTEGGEPPMEEGGEGPGEGGGEGPGEGGGEGPGEGGGEGWACDVDPDWPPCETCNDPEASKNDCDQAIADYCKDNPEDMWCEDFGGGGPGEGGDWGEPEAVYTPDSMSIKVYKVEFSEDAEGCTNPITVGENDDPEYQNFFDSPTLISADPPPAGTYPCVIITMSDHVKWTLDNDSECAGDHTMDVYSEGDDEGHDAPGVPAEGGEDGESMGGGDGIESKIRIFMSTAGSNEDPHENPDFDPETADESDFPDPFAAPGMKLHEAHIAADNVAYSIFISDGTDKVELRDFGDGELRCDMQPPDWSFATVYKDDE